MLRPHPLPAAGFAADPAHSPAAAEPVAAGSGCRRAFLRLTPFADEARPVPPAGVAARRPAAGPPRPAAGRVFLGAEANDLAALVAVTLFVASLLVWLDAAANVGGG